MLIFWAFVYIYLSTSTITSGITNGGRLYIEVNGDNAHPWTLNCDSGDICVVICITEGACSFLRANCAGNCYQYCGENGTECSSLEQDTNAASKL